jgi:hypothetical protein
MNTLAAHYTIRYPEQTHSIALVEAPDIANAIKRLDHGEPVPPAGQVTPTVVDHRLE